MKKVCRKCGLKFLATAKYFRVMPDRWQRGTQVLVPDCRTCDKAVLTAARRKRADREREKAALATWKRCTCCGREKPLDEEHFYRFLDKRHGRRSCYRFQSRCRNCVKIWLREYGRSQKGKAAQRRYQQSERGKEVAYKNNRSPSGIARNLRYNQKISKGVKKAQDRLSWAIESGRLKRPERCRDCKERKKLRAWFNRGYEAPLDVTFVCYVCWAERQRKRVLTTKFKGLDLEEESSEDPMNKFSCNKVEWQRFHELHKLRLEQESAAVSVVEAAHDGTNAKKLRAERAAFLTRLYLDEPGRNEIISKILAADGWFDGGPPPMECVLGVWVQSAGAAIDTKKRAPTKSGTGSKPGSLSGRILTAIAATGFPSTWTADDVRKALGQNISSAAIHSALAQLRQGNWIERAPRKRGVYRIADGARE